jgi:hypothetical protein
MKDDKSYESWLKKQRRSWRKEAGRIYDACQRRITELRSGAAIANDKQRAALDKEIKENEKVIEILKKQDKRIVSTLKQYGIQEPLMW